MKNTSRRDFMLTAAGASLSTMALANGLPLPTAAATPRGLRAKIVSQGGVLKIEINGQIFDPLAYRSYRPTPELIRGFAGTGLRLANVTHTGMLCTLDVPYSLFGEVWTGPEQFDWKAFDAQMELFEANAPGAYYNIAVQLDTRDWYLAAHPECSNSYWNLVETAGHGPWRTDTAASLQAFLRQIEARYGDRVFAYSLLCGSSTEWYTNSQGRGRPEALIRQHPIKTAAFRKFTGDPTATMPPLDVLQRTSHGIFRDPVADAEALRYWRFHHEIIGDAILYFAGKAQEVLQHRKLLGLFYGYLTQLNSERLLQEGHLGYERVWSCPDLDMIYAPAKYGKPRSLEGASGYLLTVDSLDLHGKLVFQEVDHTTHIARDTVENGRKIPGGNTKLPDAFASRQVLRREFALTRVKRTALWWFDFLGGNYASPEMMAMVAELVKAQGRLRDVPMRSVAQIAVFGDVPSMYHINARSSVADDLLVQPPDELARIGAPYDIYNFSDLDHPRMPWERYKLCIFLNPFVVPEAKRAFLRSKVQRNGRTLLWIYAPNYIQKDGFSVDAISDITGIKVARRAEGGSAVTVRPEGLFTRIGSAVRFGFTPGQNSSTPRDQTFDMRSKGLLETTPLFEVRDAVAQTCGVYDSNGAPALAVKKSDSHTSIYSAVGGLPSALYREIARAAGVHIYYEGRDPVYINSRLLGIHMQTDAAPAITLPLRKPCQLEELFDGGAVPVKNGIAQIPHQPGVTKLYLLTDAELTPTNKA
ncbi:MAG: hypothetical protein WCO56_23495 [Verrucomicrobiota bacterium]